MYFITKIDPLAEETVFIICRNAYDSCKWNEHEALKTFYYFQNNI